MIDDIPAERRSFLEAEISRLYAEAFEDPISPFRAGQIIDLVIGIIGPEIYNQAVIDVREHLQAKLDDLDGDVHWPLDPEGV